MSNGITIYSKVQISRHLHFIVKVYSGNVKNRISQIDSIDRGSDRYKFIYVSPRSIPILSLHD